MDGNTTKQSVRFRDYQCALSATKTQPYNVFDAGERLVQLREISDQWIMKKIYPDLKEIDVLQRVFIFKTFHEACQFIVGMWAIATDCDHHPVYEHTVRYVKVSLYTHAAGGLTLNDFIVADKLNELAERLGK